MSLLIDGPTEVQPRTFRRSARFSERNLPHAANSVRRDAGFVQGADRWIWIGDSISQNGAYAAAVFLYFVTRFPQMRFEACNCGISGDSASGALRRYEWDIQPKRATVATIMLGMNDVNRDLYSAAPASAENLRQRQAALDEYRENLVELTRRLQRDGVRVHFVTPSPFDDTAQLERENLPGVNAALAECGQIQRAVAAEFGVEVIDLHGPLTRLNLELQRGNPEFSIVGADRVHPGAAGHFAMAHCFLRGAEVPGVVAEIEIDARGGCVTMAENARVSELSVGPGGVEFRGVESSLPYPVRDDVREALAWAPFQEELNRQILRVRGLSEGTYCITIDGEAIGSFAAVELDAGVNLADFGHTPQGRQASRVGELVAKWRGQGTEGERAVAQVEHWYLKEFGHPVEFAAVDELMREKLRAAIENGQEYDMQVIERYLRVKPREKQLVEERELLEAEIWAAAQPVGHWYRVEAA